jgi:RNA recognition motif-containing protein
MPAGEYPDGSRIFIGNLASEATSKKELRAMFEAYGPVDEVILHESYGFIQFHTPEAAANAIARESGRTIGGRRIGWWRVVEDLSSTLVVQVVCL